MFFFSLNIINCFKTAFEENSSISVQEIFGKWWNLQNAQTFPAASAPCTLFYSKVTLWWHEIFTDIVWVYHLNKDNQGGAIKRRRHRIQRKLSCFCSIFDYRLGMITEMWTPSSAYMWWKPQVGEQWRNYIHLLNSKTGTSFTSTSSTSIQLNSFVKKRERWLPLIDITVYFLFRLSHNF